MSRIRTLSTNAGVQSVVAWLPFLWWFAAFKPGLMSSDSLDTWAQATEGGWIDRYPPPYTLAMWISDAVVGSPSLLTLAQSLLLASSIVAVGRALVRMGVDRRIAVGVCGVVACTPMVGAFSVSLWKDVPFTAAMLFALARVLDLVVGRPAATRLAAWLVVASLLRQNGALIALGVLAAVAVARPLVRRQAAAGATACVAAVFVTTFAVYPALGVDRAAANWSLQTFLHDIASVAGRDPDALDHADRDVLELAAPVERWGDGWQRYGCASADWMYSPDFAWPRIEGHVRSHLRLWLELLAENPRAVIGNRACAGSIAWRPDTVGVLYTVSRGVDPNRFGLATTPVVEPFHDAAVDVLDVLDRPGVQGIAWRAPGWLYLAYAVVGAAAWRRRDALLALPLAVPLAQQVAVTVLVPAQDARYMMAALLGAWLCLPLATASGRVRAVDPTPLAGTVPPPTVRRRRAARRPGARRAPRPRRDRR